MSLYVKATSTLIQLNSDLNISTNKYNKTMDQLSSGNQYTSTGDNPVEVCASEKMGVEIATSKSASSNIELGNDMLTMAENGQDLVLTNLQRVRDLCVQMNNDTYSDDQKNDIMSEIQTRLQYINYTSDSTNFNDINLMDGTADVKLQVGTDSSDRIDISSAFIDTHTDALGVDIASTVTGANWSSDDIATYINSIDTAINTLSNSAAKIGAYQNRLDTVSASIDTVSTSLTSQKSAITDTDTAEASATLVQQQILQQISTSLIVQANQIPTMALSLLNH